MPSKYRLIRSITKALILVVFICLSASCGGGGGDTSEEIAPYVIENLKTMHIESLSIHDISRFLPLAESNYEFELHVRDAATGESLLCAGVDNGMQVIQLADLEYSNLDINFINVDGVTKTQVSEITLALIEKNSDAEVEGDSFQCPNPPNYDKDKVYWQTDVIAAKDFVKDELTLLTDDEIIVKVKRNREVTQNVSLSSLTEIVLFSMSTTNIDTEASKPEYEVHIVDVEKNKDVACIGGIEDPLRSVVTENKTYDNLYSRAKLVSGSDSTETASLFRLVLVERENGSCPDAFKVGVDEIVTTSPTMTYDEIVAGTEINFFENWAKTTFLNINAVMSSVNFSDVSLFSGLKIKKIIYQGNIDEWSYPEIEVHLLDAISGETIACSGAKNGLEGVDEQEAYDNLDATFDIVWDSIAKPLDLVRVVIVERDSSECPEPATRADNDFLTEKVVSITDLTSGDIVFDNGSILILTK